MPKEKNPTEATGEPLDSNQLEELLKQVSTGVEPVEKFVAELARSASILKKEEIIRLKEALKTLPQ